VLSVITGGGKWVGITIYADPLYQHLLFTAERKFWRCVETGEGWQLHLRFSNSLDKPPLVMLINKVGHPGVRLPVSGQP
jgi:hypothetical protein